MVKITCKLDYDIKDVEVSPDDPLTILFLKLNISDKNAKFIFEGRTYSIFSFNTFREIGLIEDSTIYILNQPIIGIPIGGGFNTSNIFANFFNGFLKVLGVSKNDQNIPKWRQIGKGINLYGICNINNCEAKGKQVIMHVESDEYDVYDEYFKGICPICKKYFDLDTCSFYMCDYKCEGTYFDIYKKEWVDLPDEIQETSDGKVFYYDFNKSVPGKGSKVKYKKLILKVINYHDYE